MSATASTLIRYSVWPASPAGYRVGRLVIAERRADLFDCWQVPGLVVIDLDRGLGDLPGSTGGGKGTAGLGESPVGLAARSRAGEGLP